jgi:hypothetical protein
MKESFDQYLLQYLSANAWPIFTLSSTQFELLDPLTMLKILVLGTSGHSGSMSISDEEFGLENIDLCDRPEGRQLFSS